MGWLRLSASLRLCARQICSAGCFKEIDIDSVNRFVQVRCWMFFLLSCASITVCDGEEVRIGPGVEIGSVVAKLAPGDVLRVGKGTYVKGWVIEGLNGSAQKPIRIVGEKGAVFKVDKESRDGLLFSGKCSYVQVEGMRFSGARRAGVIVFASHHITVSNCVISANGKWGVQTCLSKYVKVLDCDISGSVKQHGVYFSTTDYPSVINSRIYDNASCGIHMNGDKGEGGDGMITGAVITGNLIYGNGRLGGAAINMDGVQQTVVSNNLMYGNSAGGIVNFRQDGAEVGDSNRFVRNTVVFKKGRGRFGLALMGKPESSVVRENVLVCGKGAAFELRTGPSEGFVSDGNLFFSYGEKAIQRDESRLSLAEWQELCGQDKVSRQGKPEFVGNGGYELVGGVAGWLRSAAVE